MEQSTSISYLTPIRTIRWLSVLLVAAYLVFPAKAYDGTAVIEDTQSPVPQYDPALITLPIPEEGFPLIISNAYMAPLIVLPIPRLLNLDIPYSKLIYCSCVRYAKAVLGVTETWGNAKDIIPTTNIPEIGWVIITTDGGGHVGVITETSGGFVTFAESNFIPCASSSRTFSLDDQRIKGYKPY